MNTFNRAQENEKKLFFYGFERNNNPVLILFLDIAVTFARFPSLIIETFWRKKFGERYYTFIDVIILFILLVAISFLPKLLTLIPLPVKIKGGFDFVLFAFACVFLFKSIQHRLEIHKYGVTYKLDRFSLSQGEYHPFFKNRWGQKLLGLPVNDQTVQILFEPLAPIAIGFVLLFTPFTVVFGTLLFTSGFLMIFRQFHRAREGRDAVLDIIDQHIIGLSKAGILLHEGTPEERRGLGIPIALPEEEEIRQILFQATEEPQLKKDSWT